MTAPLYFPSAWSLERSARFLNEELETSSVTPRSLELLAEANGIASVTTPRGRLALPEGHVRYLSEVTLVPTDSDVFDYIRVSVLARQPAPAVTYPDGRERTQAGVRIGAMKGRMARRAWTGIWPLSEELCAEAAGSQLPLLGSLRGWVHRTTARRIVGYTLVEPGRRAFITKPLTPYQAAVIFDQNEWAYIPVGRGPIAALERLR